MGLIVTVLAIITYIVVYDIMGAHRRNTTVHVYTPANHTSLASTQTFSYSEHT